MGDQMKSDEAKIEVATFYAYRWTNPSLNWPGVLFFNGE